MTPPTHHHIQSYKKKPKHFAWRNVIMRHLAQFFIIIESKRLNCIYSVFHSAYYCLQLTTVVASSQTHTAWYQKKLSAPSHTLSVFFCFFLICIIAEICSSVWDQTLCFTFVHLLWLDSSFTTAGLWAMAQLESLAGPQKIDITTFISSLLVSAGRSCRLVLYLGDVAL